MERVMSQLANYLIKDGNLDIYLILYGINREQFYGIDNRIKIIKPNFQFDNKKRLIHTIKTLLFLRNTIRKLKPKVVLSFGELWNNFVLLALLLTKIPIVVSDRCNPSKKLGLFHDILRTSLYKNAHSVIVQTEKARKLYENQFKLRNLHVIGNPIKCYNLEKHKREKIVLSVGRLIKSKQFDVLIDVFSSINAFDWKLIIVGEDDQQQQNKVHLIELIKQKKMEDKIYIEPFTESIEEWYQKASVFAFTSISEGFPNVLGEAMANELPVIAYDCMAGPSDLIENNKNGFLIEENNKVAFQQKLQTLMNDENLRIQMGNESLAYISKFDSAKICLLFKQILIDAYSSN